jgi:hypothetical protein
MIASDIGATSQKESVFTSGAYFRGAQGEYVNVRTMEVGSALRCIITGGINEISLPANRVAVDTNTLLGSIGLGFELNVGINVHSAITSVYGVDIESSVPAINLGADRIYVYCNASAAVQEPNQSDEVQQELGKFVENMIDSIFAAADDQAFEDEMESTFSRELVSAIEKYGDLAMSEVNYLITYGKVNSEVAGEALRWLARVNNPSTHGWRLWLLEKSLSSKSPVVRDSAALGLLSMCDANAIPHIREAIERETIAELRDDLQGALRELEVSLDAATSNKQT